MPVLFDGHVVWPVLWADADALRFKRSVVVLLAQADSDRCGGGWSLFTDSEGDLYGMGNAWIKKGALPVAFDPDYYVDLNEIADSPAAYFTLVGARAQLVVYWSAELSRKRLLIDEAKATESPAFSTLNDRLDDTLYMLVYEGSPSESGRASLYRVTETGAEQALTTKGQLWSIARVRRAHG